MIFSPAEITLALATFALGLSALLPACSAHIQNQSLAPTTFPFQNPALSMPDRAKDIVARMTLDEKISQMQMDAPAIDRLNIPAWHWWNEALHGVARNGAATVFPQSIGLAAAFNPELHHKIAQTIALEARAKHEEALRNDIHAINTGLDLWAPNINIFRDPRWGRGQETYGEDPYLTSRLAVAYVTGIQGDNPTYLEAIATPKHFAVHSGPELERHRLDVHITGRDLFSTYLPAFEAAVREGHAYSIIGAYNRLNGIPCCANPRLLTEILRKDWGFQGYIVSDVGAIADIYQNHQYASSPEEAAAMAVAAGCDLDGGNTYANLHGALLLGLITEQQIDQSVTRLMLARLRLGLFAPVGGPNENPYARIPYSANDSPEHDALARQAARQSLVLLKNDNQTLPLKKTLSTIAVIGPTADSVPALVSSYNGTPSHPVTILQGIRNAVSPTTRVLYDQGSPLVTEQLPLEEPVPAACLFTDRTRNTSGLKADYFKDLALAGRPFRTRIDPNIDFDWSLNSPRETILTSENFSATWSGILMPPSTGIYQLGIKGAGGYRIYLDGKRILDDWTTGRYRSIGARLQLQAAHPYALRVEYFHAKSGNPAVQLCWTRPGAEPFYANAVRAAQDADAVVLVLGLTAALEREQDTAGYQGFIGGDRQSLDLPPIQQELLEAVSAAAEGKPIVLVLTSGSAFAINWPAQHTPAILQAWYPGQQGGNAVADILFGDFSPAGKLPITLYKSVNDLPPFEDYSMDNRTYRYFKGNPLYPFGFGLSYTTFKYSNLKISPENPTTDQNITAQITITNTGTRPGDEVAQLYMSREDRHPTDPLESLQGFLRISLQPNQSKTLTFTLTPHQLADITDTGTRQTRPGPLHIHFPNTTTAIGQSITLTGKPTTPNYQYLPPTQSP